MTCVRPNSTRNSPLTPFILCIAVCFRSKSFIYRFYAFRPGWQGLCLLDLQTFRPCDVSAPSDIQTFRRSDPPDGVGGFSAFSTFRHSDLATFRPFRRGGWVLCFLDLQTFRPCDVQTLRPGWVG